MRYKLKIIIPAVVLAAMLLSMAPIVAPAAHAVEPGVTTGPTLDQAGKTLNSSGKAVDVASDFGCDLPGVGFSKCVAAVVYWIGPGLASYVASIGAYFFSIVVQLSLNSTAYALDFLSTGWTTVRDIANMAFIFILIYIALQVMLAAETSGTIKTLAVVIVIALLVNFSFFFTRVVIDAGNIVAVQFYNALPDQGHISGTNTKDLSLSIMGAVQLQKLYGQQAFDQASKACGTSSGVTCALIVSTTVYISVAAMLWMLFFAFLQVGIKFMMRIVGLWFVLIASPLAFVAKTMKQTSHFFDDWLQYLIKFSFYPAIFLFMYWILTKFTMAILPSGKNESIFTSLLNASSAADPTTGITTAIATVAIRMGFVIAVLYVGLKVSDWIVKEGSATAMKVSGWSTGKAFGLAGFAGRNSVGWLGQRASETATMRNWAAKGGVLGRTLWRGAGALGKGSFDARGLPGARTALGVLGGDVITGSRVDVGEASKKNFKDSSDARIAWREKEAAALKPSEGQVYKAIGGVVKGLSPTDKQRLMNAAGTLAQVKEDRTNGDAKSADVKAANEEYKRILTELNIKDKIKEAKVGIGSKNDKTYADSITTLGLHNLFGATSGIPFWIGKADKEAAAKIRGSKNDADQIRNVLKSLKMDVEEGYETPEPPPRTPGGGGRGGGGAGGGGGGGGGGPAVPPAPPPPRVFAPGTGAQPTPPPGGWPFSSSGNNVTVSLSKEDRDLLRRSIKATRAANDNASQGFSEIARRIANGTGNQQHANDNKKDSGMKAPSNDNVGKNLDITDENKAA